MSFLKTLLPLPTGKLWLFLTLIAVSAIAVAVVWYSAVSLNKDLRDMSTKLSVVDKKFTEVSKDLDQLKKNIDLLIKSKDIDNNVDEQVTNTKVIYKDRFDLVDKRVDEKVAEIVKRYAEMAQTDANAEMRDQEISAARLNGLWQTYCANQASAPSCLKKTNQP